MNLFTVTPHHIRLINACYPGAPLAAAPQFRPNSQELSRLTYYASNRPGKLHKISEELEKRAKNQAKRAQAGNAKFRASLLITLDILKSLIAECRRDLTLFSPGVIVAVEAALLCLPKDLEVVARAASTFTAWATYTDGTLLGVDTSLTSTYLNVLRTFALLGVSDPHKTDDEFWSRKRLVGLAALSSAIQSDALYNSMSIFSKQASIIVDALMRIVADADMSMLTTEATAVETYAGTSGPSPYIAEFQPNRPIAQRRAPSIHVHVDGEKGPSLHDVVGASLRAFQTLVAHSNAQQVPVVLEALFAAYDTVEGCSWENIELCRWLVSKVTDWTQYQYRYAIPTRLLQHLLDVKDAPKPTPLHFALVAMITTVFTSPTPLINLSTSDILTNLLNIIVARLVINPTDDLLTPLTECVASLGTHIYYADQLQDLAEEIVTRLVSVQINGLLGRGRSGSHGRGRAEGMRCLVACLAGLLQVADEAHPTNPTRPGTVRRASEKIRIRDDASGRFSGESIRNDAPPGPSREISNPGDRINSPDMQRSRRNKVAPEVWQDTLALLCEAEYAVRGDYAIALERFIREEIVKEPYATKDEGSDAMSRMRRLASVEQQADLICASDATTRFLHALHAAAFTLALAPHLGLQSTVPSASSSTSLNGMAPIKIIPPTPLTSTPREEVPPSASSTTDPESTLGGASSDQVHRNDGATSTTGSNPARRSTPPGVRGRQASVGLSLLNIGPPDVSGSPATLSDYSHILRILTAVHQNLPARSLLTGVPMLFALDAAVGGASEHEDEILLHKRKAVREVICKMWGVIATIWECPGLKDVAEKVNEYFSPVSSLPEVPKDDLAPLLDTREPLQFGSVQYKPVDHVVLSPTYIVQPEVIIAALSINPNVQRATGMDHNVLKTRLSAGWSSDKAVKDSFDLNPCVDTVSRTEGGTHFLKISPGLMHIDNQSLASLARTARGVGVDDLREALEGRASMSNPNLISGAHSMSTEAERKSHRANRDIELSKIALATAHTRRKASKTNSPSDVANALNKLGIGKQTTSKLLHTPLQQSTNKSSETSPSKVLVPPYAS